MGLKFFDARRKKQVADMLQTAAGEPAVTITNLLKEIEPDKPDRFKALLSDAAVLASTRRSRFSRPA